MAKLSTMEDVAGSSVRDIESLVIPRQSSPRSWGGRNVPLASGKRKETAEMGKALHLLQTLGIGLYARERS